MRTDGWRYGQTDVFEPVVDFSNFAEALKKTDHYSHQISSPNLNKIQVHSVNIISNFYSKIAFRPLFFLHSRCFHTHFPFEIPVPPNPYMMQPVATFVIRSSLAAVEQTTAHKRIK